MGGFETRNSAELKAFVLDCASEGMSGNAIATKVYQELKIVKSRNAIIGIVHRCGATLKKSNRRQGGTNAGRARFKEIRDTWNAERIKRLVAKKQPKKKLHQPKTSPLTGLPKIPPGGASRLPREPLPKRQARDKARISYRDFERGKHCCYIPGDETAVPDTVPIFCGLKPIAPGQSYCEEHDTRCRNPVLPRRVTDAHKRRYNFAGSARVGTSQPQETEDCALADT